ncbi:hypothetical protein CR161_09965 [Prosthecochloris sp. ZM]|uniref:hypothetical protein n=1 Tax=unclassified Prosthecochloris TaxID=2632826 RepID=UPI000DF787C3|nr:MULTISPECIES: hypothetical protein [unclassified Prosthecochloris]NEX12443.1 hypothetical protein [Prosthecochloris sp.]RDD30996.1 hypothetical protein CR161_09965 [Prosthecochloris sp. ZM]
MMQEIPGSEPAQNKTGQERSSNPHIPDQVAGVSEHVADLYNQFRESRNYSKLQDAKQQMKEYIKDNPVESVLYSLGAGVVLGFILHKKR